MWDRRFLWITSKLNVRIYEDEPTIPDLFFYFFYEIDRISLDSERITTL